MSRRKRMKARDKVALKNTRDGLIERNAATGEDISISKREADFDLRGEKSDKQSFSQVGKRSQADVSSNKSKRKQVYRNAKSKHTKETDAAVSHSSLIIPVAQTAIEASAVPKATAEQSDNLTDTPPSKSETVADIPQSVDKPPGSVAKLTATQRLYTDKLREPAKTDTPLKHEREPTLIVEQNDTSQSADVSGTPQTQTKRQAPHNSQMQPDTLESAPTSEYMAEQLPVPPNTSQTSSIPKPPEDKPASLLKPDKPGKLQFTQEEVAPAEIKPRGLMKAERQMERTSEKLEKAQNHLPTKHKLRRVSVTDKQTGNVSRKLSFEKMPISQSQHMKGSLPLRPVKAAGNALMLNAHRKIYQVEHENVSVKAAHRTEMVAEGGIRAALHFRKTASYNKVEKLERKARKKSINLAYQKALAENPKLKSSMLSRAFQKRKIKKEYAKATREAQKAAKQAGSITSKAINAVAGIVKRHPAATAAVVLIALLLFAMMSLISMFGSMGSGALGGILSASYLAEDADIDKAEVAYTEWETDLLMEIESAESDYPGYDEYRYNVGDISHNPYELLAYLTVKYQNFPYDGIESELRALFDEQYDLTFTPTIETRYADPTDADDDGDYEPYEWHILTVTLTAKSFTDIATSHLSGEQLAHYALLLQTKGSRQYVGNPFGDMNWLSYVTSYYGYRVHPISGEKDLHRAVDIGLPTGTEIQSVQDGTVTFAGYSGGYGNVVIIENDKGIVSKYAHCDSLLVSTGQTINMGDVIATVGNTGNSTGSHLHLELLKDGLYLNPLFFIDTGSFGTTPIYGDPGTPMGDGTYAALIAEAEKHLGKPYVFGSNGPNSFDCSSYICYILTQSGVKNMPRTTAQGIYNQCTPIPESERQPGDIVFFHSTYSTSNTVTHVALYVGDGMIIHAGSPIQYTRIDGNSYWQAHLYSYGRLPN